jgi:tetratricopeptide (TPR) repeat protein
MSHEIMGTVRLGRELWLGAELMNRRTTFCSCLIALAGGALAAANDFSLTKAIPGDAFLMVAERHNPERDFLRDYWADVRDAFVASGVVGDLMEIAATLLNDEQRAEVERVAGRFTELLKAVDWGELSGREIAFGERMRISRETDHGINMGAPDMVLLMRAADAGASYAGLAAILTALCEEINTAAGAEALKAESYTHGAAAVTGVNLLSMAPGAPEMYLLTARRDDVVAIGLGRGFVHDALDLLSGNSAGKSLADDSRFAEAFSKLPPAEDTMFFFDLQNLLRPIRRVMDFVALEMGAPDDVYRNTGSSREGSRQNALAMSAYRDRDYQKALDLVKQGHESDPRDANLLYNLACFNALTGRPDEALGWLERAVEGGFYAPGKITTDSDLVTLREHPRYAAAVARASELAALHSARDVVINASKSTEAYKLILQAGQLCDQENYEQALSLSEQAYAMDSSDSRVLYVLACVHAAMNHEGKSLELLNRAVEAGYYCPKHIAGEASFQNMRDSDRYAAALDLARHKAAGLTQKQSGNRARVFAGIADRIMSAVSIVDYIASVEYTDGYTVHSETIAALVPDAKSRAFYPVLASAGPIGKFDRFVPQEAESFSISGGLDLAALYAFVLETVRQSGPKGEELLAKWGELQTEIGIDLQADLLAWVGSEMTSITLADGAGSIFLLEINDEPLARAMTSEAIEMLSEHLSELARGNPGLAMLSVSTSETDDEQLAGFQNLHFAIAPTTPLVWGVAERHLIVGTSEEAVALCLNTAKGDHPSIQENPRVMSELVLPDGPCVAVYLTDQRRTGQEIGEVLAVIGPMSGMMGMAIPDPQARKVIARVGGILGKLAPVARKIDFYKSNSAYTTFDGSAWRSSSVTHYQDPQERGLAAP